MSEDLVEGWGFYEGKIQSIVGNNLHISVDIKIRADILKIKGRQPNESWKIGEISYFYENAKDITLGESVLLRIHVPEIVDWQNLLTSLTEQDWFDISKYLTCYLYTNYADYQDGMLFEFRLLQDYYFDDCYHGDAMGSIIEPLVRLPGRKDYITDTVVVYGIPDDCRKIYEDQIITVEKPVFVKENVNSDYRFEHYCVDFVANYSIPAWNAFIKKYHEGDIVEGDVQKQNKEGLLVDIDNFWTMLPTNEIDYGTYIKPKDLVGQHIKVKILHIYEDLHKVIVSRKQANKQNTKPDHSAKKHSHDELQELRQRIEQLEKQMKEIIERRDNLGNTIKKHDSWW